MSKTLRPYRDFTKEEDPFPEGNEVILVGGDPDIVRVGSQATPNGFMFDVWIPNDARYYNTSNPVYFLNALNVDSHAAASAETWDSATGGSSFGVMAVAPSHEW